MNIEDMEKIVETQKQVIKNLIQEATYSIEDNSRDNIRKAQVQLKKFEAKLAIMKAHKKWLNLNLER